MGLLCYKHVWWGFHRAELGLSVVPISANFRGERLTWSSFLPRTYAEKKRTVSWGWFGCTIPDEMLCVLCFSGSSV